MKRDKTKIIASQRDTEKDRRGRKVRQLYVSVLFHLNEDHVLFFSVHREVSVLIKIIQITNNKSTSEWIETRVCLISTFFQSKIIFMKTFYNRFNIKDTF